MIKKIIIFGFFGFMIFLSVAAVKITGSIQMGKENITFRKISHTLSGSEIINEKIYRKDGNKYVRYYETNETRTPKIFGWNTKIDTLKSYVMEESNE